MGLPWIRVYASLPTHRKALHLGAILREPRAWTHLVQLWLWASEHQPSGIIPGPAAPLVVEQVAGWRGDPGALADALVVTGWLTRDGDALVIHDWDDHQLPHIEKAERDKERVRRWRAARSGTRDVTRTDGDVTRNVHGREGEGEGEGEAPSLRDGAGGVAEPPPPPPPPVREESPLLVPVEPPAPPPSPPKPRKLSGQEQAVAWAGEQRAKWLPDAVSDRAWSPRDINARIKPILAEVGGAGFRQAYLRFLGDPYAQGLTPPCPLSFFTSEWRRYYDPDSVELATQPQPQGAQQELSAEAPGGSKEKTPAEVAWLRVKHHAVGRGAGYGVSQLADKVKRVELVNGVLVVVLVDKFACDWATENYKKLFAEVAQDCDAAHDLMFAYTRPATSEELGAA